MKTIASYCPVGLLLFVCAALPVLAEGPLTPPGAPAPTMKTLQELWDKMEALEAKVDAIFTATGASLPNPGSIEMVTVGNPGNGTDPDTGSVYGAVSYEYKIGKYEVSNAEYAVFLNAVADADPNNLFNAEMGNHARGGIARSGTTPNFVYAVRTNMGDKPVNYVNRVRRGALLQLVAQR